MWPFKPKAAPPPTEPAVFTVTVSEDGTTKVVLTLPPDAEKQRSIINQGMMSLTGLLLPVVIKTFGSMPPIPTPPMRQPPRDFDNAPVVDAFSAFAVDDDEDEDEYD